MNYSVGIRVFSKEHNAWGEIIKTDGQEPYPILVAFEGEVKDPEVTVDNQNQASFTADGFRSLKFREAYPEFRLKHPFALENVFLL